METKKCFKCEEIKSLCDFYKHPKMKDGHLNKCKSCTMQDSKKIRTNNIDYYKKYDRERSSLEYRVEQRKQYYKLSKCDSEKRKQINNAKKKYIVNNKDKTRARAIVSYNLKKGYIKKENCAICGSIESEAHHPDYNYPLSIVWLCDKHHKEEHKKIKSL